MYWNPLEKVSPGRSLFPFRRISDLIFLDIEDKVIDHNFGSLIRMNSEEEYSESNTIFSVFRHPVPRSVIKLLGSDARAIPGFRGDCCVRNHHRFPNANNVPRSLVTV